MSLQYPWMFPWHPYYQTTIYAADAAHGPTMTCQKRTKKTGTSQIEKKMAHNLIM